MKTREKLVLSAARTEELDETSAIRIEQKKGQNEEGERADEEESEVKGEKLGGKVQWKVPVEAEEVLDV